MKNNFVVIFDLDFTVWSHVPFENQTIDMAKYLKVPYCEEFTNQVMNFWSGEFLNDTIISEETVALMAEKNIPYLSQHGVSGKKFLDSMNYTDRVWLNDGAIKLLDYLKNNGYTIIAYTDYFLDFQLSLMERLKCRSYFEEVYSWDGNYQKPNKERIEGIVSKYPGKKFIYIGDSLNKDMKSASYIKDCISIWYNDSHETGDLKITYCTSDLNSILSFLSNM